VRVLPALAIGLLLCALLGAGDARAQSADDQAPQPAVEAVSATVEVERILLKEDVDRHERVAADRVRVTGKLTELYVELEAAVKRTDGQGPRTIEEVRARIEPAESERSELVAEEQALLDRILDRQRRIRLLEERIASLHDRVQEEAGPLGGRWDIVLLPLQQRGSFALVQNGTLVHGTYQLDGGWSGSLQGTLVNRKVHLDRIDSKLGRSAEFEGYLSTDGSRIRGTWRSYELSAQDAASGQWSATRKPQGP
jgi:hypothetical protein